MVEMVKVLLEDIELKELAKRCDLKCHDHLALFSVAKDERVSDLFE